MNKQQIKELALANGFKLKQQPNGEMDLNPYVYEFAIEQQIKVIDKVVDALRYEFEGPRDMDSIEEFIEEHFAQQLRKELEK